MQSSVDVLDKESNGIQELTVKLGQDVLDSQGSHEGELS